MPYCALLCRPLVYAKMLQRHALLSACGLPSSEPLVEDLKFRVVFSLPLRLCFLEFSLPSCGYYLLLKVIWVYQKTYSENSTMTHRKQLRPCVTAGVRLKSSCLFTSASQSLSGAFGTCEPCLLACTSALQRQCPLKAVLESLQSRRSC